MWSFYVYAFRARFKTAATPSFIVAFFLLPVMVLSLGIIFNQGNGLTIRAGIYAPESPVAARVAQSVIYYGQSDCEVVLYTDEEQLKADVAAHKLECGYVLTEAVELLASEGAIITYRSPMTVTEKVLDLIVAAAYLEAMAGELGAEVLEPYKSAMNDEHIPLSSADIQTRADEYLKNGALMEMVLIESGANENAANPPAPYRRLFHGLTGLFGLLLALLCAMGLASDTQKDALERVKSTGRGGAGFMLAGFGVVFAVVCSFLCLSIAAGEMLYPGLTVGWLAECLAGLTYALALAGCGALLAAYVRADIFPALLSFMFIFAALLGSVFFDLREVLASISFLRFLCINYYYLDAIGKAASALPWPQAVVLTGFAMVTGALALRKAGRG